MLNHSLFLRPPSLPWCWGRVSPSSPRRASRLVHEHGQRCLPALAHCPRCTRLEPLVPACRPNLDASLPSPSPNPVSSCPPLSQAPECCLTYLRNTSPVACLLSSTRPPPRRGLSCSPCPSLSPPRIPSQGSWGHVRPRHGHPAPLLPLCSRRPQGGLTPPQAQLRGVHGSRCSSGIFPQHVGRMGL